MASRGSAAVRGAAVSSLCSVVLVSLAAAGPAEPVAGAAVGPAEPVAGAAVGPAEPVAGAGPAMKVAVRSPGGTTAAATGDRLGAATTPARRPARRVLPAVIGARPSVRQMVTVTAASWDSTRGRLKAWRRTARGRWVLARGPIPVVIGYGGWVVAADRLQNTGTTPAGRFRMPAAFGRLRDPGAHLPYRHVDRNDWWPYEPRDPATYNVYQRHRAGRTHWRRTFAEHLVTYTQQYRYAVEVGFNLARGVHYSKARRQWVGTRLADTSMGGGIFLHVRGDGLTAGCVAMDQPDMRWLLTWLRPGSDPRLVMGPHSYLVTL